MPRKKKLLKQSDLSNRARAIAREVSLEARRIAVLEAILEKLCEIAETLKEVTPLEKPKPQVSQDTLERLARRLEALKQVKEESKAEEPPSQNPCIECGRPGVWGNEGRWYCKIHEAMGKAQEKESELAKTGGLFNSFEVIQVPS